MYEYNAIIKRVVDGDTVDVDIDLGFDVVLTNQRIRLYGMDTPESRTRDPIEKVFGKMAKEFLEEKLGETCTLRSKVDKRGKFGRILGEFVVYDHNEDREMTVNEIMIRDNLAVPYHGQSKQDIEEAHLKNREILIERFSMSL